MSSFVGGCSVLISIHALREESDGVRHVRQQGAVISIHALREESDSDAQHRAHRIAISIHALREESDFNCASLLTANRDFNPRSP